MQSLDLSSELNCTHPKASASGSNTFANKLYKVHILSYEPGSLRHCSSVSGHSKAYSYMSQKPGSHP